MASKRTNYRRYYLHEKIKKYRILLRSRQKLVEMEEQLFRFPPALLSTYLHKLGQFNYNIQSTIMLPETNTNNQIVKFVEKEELVEKFNYVNSRLKILDKASLELKVETEQQLVIAENNAKEVVQLLKEVDNTRKLLKKPYADVVKMIDNYCRIIDDNFTRIKVRFISQITDYKVIQQAALNADKEAKLRDLEMLESEKQAEADKIKRIESQLIARIYGGTYTKRNGTPQNHTGCIKYEDCDDLLIWINENIPPIDSFVHFSALYEEIIIDIKKKLAEYRANMYNLHVTNATFLKEQAIQKINEARNNAVEDHLLNSNLVDEIIEKDSKKNVRALDNEVKDAGKGVRNVLTFDITDDLLVPRDFLSVDNSKVISYINVNKERIKDLIAGNKEVVPGIRFFIESTYIAR